MPCNLSMKSESMMDKEKTLRTKETLRQIGRVRENNKVKNNVMATHFTKFALSRSTDTKVEECLTLDEKKH